MAPPSEPHLVLLDDDDDDDHYEDDFDWEAAVREIDSACEASTASHARVSGPAPPRGFKQSTIDRFVDKRSRSSHNGSEGRGRDDMDVENAWSCGREGRICVQIDLDAARTWIYPVNMPVRQYQLSIAEVSLFQNTLVALPTGLGKTLIAAVVMFNYLRWFPEGKIVFAAPSRPLVMQQIDACLNIVGIPRVCTVDMTGLTSPPKRSKLWGAKKVFFVTPQVLEKDIQSGICPITQLVCLVIDEAHKAKGNYSYCVVVRKVMSASIQLRILALTATPGSKQQEVQKVIDNLNISRLEYRSETDQDVSPYVHNREYELIQVAPGKDAVRVDDLLLQVIKPYINILSSAGVLLNRDYTTVSPYQLIDSRDKFRASSLNNINPAKYKEIDGAFALLLTLYHIRKLLSSHGMRPAYDMLDGKLKEWPLQKLGTNDFLCQAKKLMLKSLSHGAPNPKLVKLTEILVEHFKLKDPRSSRVIIFSSFRGSVRDILESLLQIGEIIKATEFIGQNSGKLSKGQNQKVQQAVLQKFRDGGYNVIVATSIGEEGLDIMEVDLVICFDSNISPLRMTQRMGRTARKNDGRVVVLACEGPELKGYIRKQATGKAIRKHMYNGGSKSFSFHPSPRMVPHICKPEVQFVEVSVERPASLGTTKDTRISPSAMKFSEEESELIARYFHGRKEDVPVLSLIAFPHFQAFPSRVHEVQHSLKTSLFIHTVQCIQGVSGKGRNASSMKGLDSYTVVQPIGVLALDINGDSLKDLPEADEMHHPFGQTEGLSDNPILKSPVLSSDLSGSNGHKFIFDTKLVSVSSRGNVVIAPVPQLPFIKEILYSKILLTESETCQSGETVKVSYIPDSVHDPNCTTHPELRCIDNEGCLDLKSTAAGIHHHVGSLEPEEVVPQTPCDQIILDSEDAVAKMFKTDAVNSSSNMTEVSKSMSKKDGTVDNKQLNQWINHFIEKGVVPESPVANHFYSGMEDTYNMSFMHKQGNCDLLVKFSNADVHLADEAHGSSTPLNIAGNVATIGQCYKQHFKSDVYNSPPSKFVKHEEDQENVPTNFFVQPSIINNGFCTPVVKQAIDSTSDEWQPSLLEEVCKSVESAPKYKRLRKNGSTVKPSSSPNTRDLKTVAIVGQCSHTKAKTSSFVRSSGMKKVDVHAMSFIEEEAEVSEDVAVSEDENEVNDEDKYDDSFIDDQEQSTVASSLADDGGDMMAFYRRSLLTQSPADASFYSDFSAQNSARIMEIGSGSTERVSISAITPRSRSCSTEKNTTPNTVSHHAASEWVNISSVSPQSRACIVDKFTPLTSSNNQAAFLRNPQQVMRDESSRLADNQDAVENRKRKLNFQCFESQNKVPVHPVCLQNNTPKNEFFDYETEQRQQAVDTFDDDFYTGLDLDALEAQATSLLKANLKPSIVRPLKLAPGDCGNARKNPDSSLMEAPSFDLGI